MNKKSGQIHDEIGVDPQVGVNGPTVGQKWTHGGAEMSPRRGRGGPTAGQRWTHGGAETAQSGKSLARLADTSSSAR
uniref:Uncharacterized protein n=1 Tax=Fagus sylvatica TaxID=28930 RepID=A0A2N9H623_FAGSY